MKPVCFFILLYASVYLLSLIPQTQITNEDDVDNYIINKQNTSDNKMTYNIKFVDADNNAKPKL